MGLRLDEIDRLDELGLVEEWRFDARPFFMRSAAYETLTRELRAYVQGEIRGRSFLIAAHRGVGKTSLILRAVDDLARERLRSAMVAAGDTAGEVHHFAPQRPLLVKLHGSALLTSASPEPSLAPSPRLSPRPSAEGALQQIAIALYRALAREIAEAFALHAREAALRQKDARDLPELAAKLTLDLDLAPDLAALRACWQRLQRLAFGILWPDSVGRRLVEIGLADRGMREIVALATANQTFQVCAGRVEASQSTKGSAGQTARLESSTRLDAKDAANKLFGLTAGALVGGALLSSNSSGAVAAAAGLGAALVGALALNWSVERHQRSERSSDYTFIMDRSLQTLDRDLPVVIERIREVGLAPVFLVDELDKLEAPGASIEAIVKRLKNLTTDYGFFCFLTDRAYFEEIETKLRATAYPIEHTFFSHRLLLMYNPAELARYVRDLWTIDAPQTADLTAAWVLSCVVLHRARLNAMDLRRELTRLCNENGTLRADPTQLVSAAAYRVPMAVQLAIEHVLRHPDIRLRVENDIAFAQLAVDVLYMISRAWDDGATKIVVDEAAVREYLVSRRCVDGNRAAAEAALAAAASDADIATLADKAWRLAVLLTSFSNIYYAVNFEERAQPLPSPPPPPPYASTAESEGAKLATLAPLLTGIPGVPDGLLKQEPNNSSIFRLMFDRYSVGYTDWEETLLAMQRAETLFDAVTAGLRANGISIALLVEGGVLPGGIDDTASLYESSLRSSVELLSKVSDTEALRRVPHEDIDRITAFASAAQQSRRAIVAIVALTGQITSLSLPGHSNLSIDAAAVLAAIDHMLGMSPLVAILSAPVGITPYLLSLKSPDSPVVPTTMNAIDPEWNDSEEGWTAAIGNARTRLPTVGLEAPRSTWDDRVARWVLRRERPINPPVEFVDIFAAAAGLFPVTHLRPDFETMTVAMWSRLSMLAFAHRSDETLSWTLVAGLRALGFGARILQTAVQEAPGGKQFVEAAPADRLGVLYLFGTTGEIAGPPDPTGPPVFAVPVAEQDNYIEIVEWLVGKGAFGAAVTMES